MSTVLVVPLQGGSVLGPQLFFMFAIFMIFYFIVFRPMRKQRQDTELMLSRLKNGDKVVTSGGIYGTVVGVNEDAVQLRVAEHVKIQIAKSAVARLVDEPAKRS